MDKFLLSFFSFGWLRGLDFLAPLALRLYLAPMFWVSGAKKLGLFTSPDFAWYNPLTWINMDAVQAAAPAFQGGIFADFAANFLTISIAGLEVVGAILLILGLAVRWITIPLIFIVGVMGLVALNGQSLEEAGTQFIMNHGYTTIANNKFEVSVAHVIMLFTLFFMGAGRFFSLDWFIAHGYYKKIENKKQKKSVENDDPFAVDTMDDEDLKV